MQTLTLTPSLLNTLHSLGILGASSDIDAFGELVAEYRLSNFGSKEAKNTVMDYLLNVLNSHPLSCSRQTLEDFLLENGFSAIGIDVFGRRSHVYIASPSIRVRRIWDDFADIIREYGGVEIHVTDRSYYSKDCFLVVLLVPGEGWDERMDLMFDMVESLPQVATAG